MLLVLPRLLVVVDRGSVVEARAPLSSIDLEETALGPPDNACQLLRIMSDADRS